MKFLDKKGHIFEFLAKNAQNDVLNQCTESNDEQEIDSDIERMQETRLESSFQFSAALTEPATKNPLVNNLQLELRKYIDLDINKWKQCK